MRVARVGWQQGCHLDFNRTIFHATNSLNIGLFQTTHLSAWPKCMGRDHAIAVGHAGLHLRDGLVTECEVVRHNPAKVQQESSYGVYLVGCQ